MQSDLRIARKKCKKNKIVALFNIFGKIGGMEKVNITIRMPREMRDKLAECAKKQCRSLNNYIVFATLEYTRNRKECEGIENLYSQDETED